MFFKKKEKKSDDDFYTKVCALLIHAAKIDENYTDNGEKIIKQTLEKLGIQKVKIPKILEEAKIIEENSNQILEFTKEVKNLSNQNKIQIVEALWSIIYSNKYADVYESNLMRRLAGLLYISDVKCGNAKITASKRVK